MKYRNKIGLCALALALMMGALGAPAAHAGKLNSAAGEVAGDGVFNITNNKKEDAPVKVKSATLNFKLDKSFTLDFLFFNEKTLGLKGTWKQADNDSIELAFEMAASDGKGSLSFKVRSGERQPDRLRISIASTEKGAFKMVLNLDVKSVKNYSVNWESDKNGDNAGKPAITEFSANVDGSGSVETTNNGTTKLNKVDFSFSKDGQAFIRFDDSNEAIFVGTWNVIDSKRLGIKLKIPINGTPAVISARGVIFLKAGAVERFNLSGALGKTSFIVKFTAK